MSHPIDLDILMHTTNVYTPTMFDRFKDEFVQDNNILSVIIS